MNYTVILQQEPDGGFVAVVPVLPGCVSQGDTRSEELANIGEAMAVYIEDCIESGESIPPEAAQSAPNGSLLLFDAALASATPNPP